MESIHCDFEDSLSPVRGIQSSFIIRTSRNSLAHEKSFSEGSGLLELSSNQQMGQREYKCAYCSRTFANSMVLTQHIRVHTGEKPFVCKICQKAFTQLGQRELSASFGFSISQHISKSSEESGNFSYEQVSFEATENFSPILSSSEIDLEKLSHKCPFCGKMFAYDSQVKRHMRTHTGEKPYACEYCNKTFAQRIEVLKHTRTHTGEKPFQCSLCDYRSAQLCNVKTHMKAKHATDWVKFRKQVSMPKF